MGIFGSKGPKLSDCVAAWVFGRRLQCSICGEEIFRVRRYKLETNVSVNIGPAIFADTSLTLECLRCGYHLQFAATNPVRTFRIPYQPDRGDVLDLAAVPSAEPAVPDQEAPQ